MQFILASASPARRETLRRAGIGHVVEVSDVDEDAILATFPSGAVQVREKVCALAAAKADAVAARHAGEDVLVLGCDSMFVLGNALHGKPGTPERARERLAQMSGRTGTLVTGHCLLRVATGERALAAASTDVTIADMTDAEMDAYVASGEPVNVAGSFTIDGLGGPFVAAIAGDHHNVVGLSLPLLRSLCREVGVAITSLWR